MWKGWGVLIWPQLARVYRLPISKTLHFVGNAYFKNLAFRGNAYFKNLAFRDFRLGKHALIMV
jgi:hypothetical protein